MLGCTNDIKDLWKEAIKKCPTISDTKRYEHVEINTRKVRF